MSDARVVIVVQTQSPTGWRSMVLELPRSERTLEDLHEFARGVAEEAGVLTEQTTETEVRVSFPDGPPAPVVPLRS